MGADSVHRRSDEVRRVVALHWWGVETNWASRGGALWFREALGGSCSVVLLLCRLEHGDRRSVGSASDGALGYCELRRRKAW